MPSHQLGQTMKDGRLLTGSGRLIEDVQTGGNALGGANPELARTDGCNFVGAIDDQQWLCPDSDFTSMQFLGLSST